MLDFRRRLLPRDLVQNVLDGGATDLPQDFPHQAINAAGTVSQVGFPFENGLRQRGLRALNHIVVL